MDRKRGCSNGQLGTLLRKLRREAGLTQQALAASSGLSVGMIRDLEQDRTGRPYRWSLEQLGRALQLDARTIDGLVTSEPAQRGTVAANHVGGPPQTWHTADGLWIQVLGPLNAWRDGVPIPLGGEKQRIVLGVLALQPNTWLHRDSLVDAVWGEEPPASAANLVQTYTARVQRLLCRAQNNRPKSTVSAVAVARNSNRYRLEIPTDRLDLLASERLAAEARRAQAVGDLSRAYDCYEGALQMWQGEPLCDIDALRYRPSVNGLHRRWAALVVDYAEACFQDGWYQRGLPLVEELVWQDPLNEHAQACLMVGFAGTGHQAAAMAVYQNVRNKLVEQLGILPGPVLSEAYDRILHRRIAPNRRPQSLAGLSDLTIA